MSNKKKIFILTGAPGTGKTTWANKHHPNGWRVSTDDIIEDMAEMAGLTYNDVFHENYKVSEKIMWEQFKHHVVTGKDPIIVDRTNMTVKSRRRFFEQMKHIETQYEYEFHSVVFLPSDRDEHIRRLNGRPGKNIPLSAVDAMISSYQEPKLIEGFASVTLERNI